MASQPLNDEEEIIYENPIKDLERCTFCKDQIEKIGNNELTENKHRDFCLWYCQNCRFWQARIYSTFRACMPPPDNLVYKSKLREFNSNLPEGCETEMALHIRRHPDLLHSFKPRRFEEFVANVFRANFTNAEVLHVGGPYDGGIDILLIDTEKGQWLIQVKHRKSQQRAEGVDTIRNVLGVMIENGIHKSIVVSTAKRFSLYAKKLATQAEAEPYCMNVRLVDKDILNKMLDSVLPDRPWLDPITEVDEEIANYLADQIPSDNQLNLFEPQPFIDIRKPCHDSQNKNNKKSPAIGTTV